MRGVKDYKKTTIGMGVKDFACLSRSKSENSMRLSVLTAVLLIFAPASACWAPPHRVATPLSRSRACTEGQVPVLHNPTERSSPIFVTDPAKEAASKVLAHQAAPMYGTRELGVL